MANTALQLLNPSLMGDLGTEELMFRKRTVHVSAGDTHYCAWQSWAIGLGMAISGATALAGACGHMPGHHQTNRHSVKCTVGKGSNAAVRCPMQLRSGWAIRWPGFNG